MPENEAKLILDGPSALELYRNRDALRSEQEHLLTPQHQLGSPAYDTDFSELEDGAAELANSSIFDRMAESDREFAERGTVRVPELERTRMRLVRNCSFRSRDLKRILYEDHGISRPSPNDPLYILVPSSDQKYIVVNVHNRQCACLIPERSFLGIGNEVRVPTPEFMYLLMAHYLTLPGLILLGMEICGHYRLTAPSCAPFDSKGAVFNRSPLTSSAKLQRYIARAGSFGGVDVCKRALKYVADNAASPMESVLYLLLCLPAMLGGNGLQKPILNAKRPVSKLANSFTLSNYLVPDLYWPDAKLDLEYDSEAFHANSESLRAGARRTMALRTMGVTVISVTKDIVYDKEAFDGVARHVAKATGKRTRKITKRGEVARIDLRQSLLYNRASLYKPRLQAIPTSKHC